jgi:hypothetical protein
MKSLLKLTCVQFSTIGVQTTDMILLFADKNSLFEQSSVVIMACVRQSLPRSRSALTPSMFILDFVRAHTRPRTHTHTHTQVRRKYGIILQTTVKEDIFSREWVGETRLKNVTPKWLFFRENSV